jgi:hypothetical protein
MGRGRELQCRGSGHTCAPRGKSGAEEVACLTTRMAA